MTRYDKITKYDKLVRDNIPDIIAAKGKTFKIHLASTEEYETKLREKLQEEVKEYLESKDPEELADMLEVIHALAALHSQTPVQLESVRAEKAASRGGFSKRIILEEA